MLWWDPDTLGRPPAAGGTQPKGTYFYVNGGKRYSGDDWPTTSVEFFDKATSTYWDQLPTQPPPERIPCSDCPSETGKGEPPSAA